MAGFKIQIQTTAANEVFTLPTVSGQSYNSVVYWGDTSNSTITTWDDVDRAHTYVTPGIYIIEITGQFDGWSVNNTNPTRLQIKSIVDWGDSIDFDGFAYLANGFYGCVYITSLPSGSIIAKSGLTSLNNLFRSCSALTGLVVSTIFDNCTNVSTAEFLFSGAGITGLPANLFSGPSTSLTNLNYAFFGCSSLTNLYFGIFNSLTNLTNAYNLFLNCTSITTVPAGMFDTFTGVVSLRRTFYGCVNLTTIPSGLFRLAVASTAFDEVFYNCNKLKIIKDIFYNEGEQSTRFLNKTVNFTNCFNRTPNSPEQGEAPDLWNCDFGTGTPIKTGCFSGNSVAELVNYKDIPSSWGGGTWSDPTITDVDGDEKVFDNQSNVLVTGTDFLYSGAKFEIGDDSNYSIATLVEQTKINQTDTSALININFGSFEPGLYYLFVTTGQNQTSSGIQIELYQEIYDLAKNTLSSIYNTGQMLGYSEPSPTAEVLSLDMYRFLLEPIRQADKTREGALFVKRLLEGPQTIWRQTFEKIFQLKDLQSKTNCPDEYLKYLKNHVGWSDNLNDITNNLSYKKLRTLISESPNIWSNRGREETIINTISLVTGAKCMIYNWFDYRWITGETVFGEQHEGNDPWIIEYPGAPEYDEYRSVIRVVDNGDIDRDLLIETVKLMRAVSERLEITYVQFFDNFDTAGDDSQWLLDQGSGDIVVDNGYATLDDSTAQYAIVDNAYSYDWSRYVFYNNLSGDDIFGSVFYYIDSDNYYQFKLTANSTAYELSKVVSGTPSVISSGNLTWTTIEDTYYGIRIHIDDETSTNRIKVYIDGTEIINTTDNSLSKGTIGFFSGLNSTAKLTKSELFVLPLETDLVDINS